MPTRPKQHQLEDLSLVRFKSIIPERWIVREKSKDYGIDAEVEIIDSSNQTTGKIFFVQLKATESSRSNVINSVSMKIDTLLYYKKLQVPVMLARYSKHLDSFKYAWVNNVDLYGTNSKAKSFTVSMVNSPKLDNETISMVDAYTHKFQILKNGEFSFPTKTSIKIHEDLLATESSIITESRIHTYVQTNLSRYVEVCDREVSLFQIDIDKSIIKISASEIDGAVLHLPDNLRKGFNHKSIIEQSLFGLSLVFFRLNKIDLGSRLIFENSIIHRIREFKKLIPFIIPYLVRSSFYGDFLDEVIDLLEDDKLDIEDHLMLTLSLLPPKHLRTEKINNSIERIHLKRVESIKSKSDSERAAIAYYNLGNFYQGQNEYLSAIKYYNRARKSSKLYHKQPYFFKEFAGLFFLEEKFTLSAKLYHKSLELDPDNHTLQLYADSLMFSGRFEDAYEALNPEQNSDFELKDEFYLKAILLRYIIEKFEIKHQQRRSVEALNISGVKEGESPDKDNLIKALELDALCPLAWYNLGLVYSQKRNFQEAAFAYSLAALIQTNDIESWVKATLFSIIGQLPTTFLLALIKSAYWFNRQEYITTLLETLDKDSIPRDVIITIKGFIQDITKEINAEREPIAIRIKDSDGRFRDLFKEITE